MLIDGTDGLMVPVNDSWKCTIRPSVPSTIIESSRTFAEKSMEALNKITAVQQARSRDHFLTSQDIAGQRCLRDVSDGALRELHGGPWCALDVERRARECLYS